MQRIPMKFASAGMVLHKPITREDGMVLAGEGTVLTDSIIDRLKNSEIPSIVVKGRPVPGLESDMDLNKVRERLPHLFRKYTDDPLMNAMRNMLDQHLIKAIALEEESRRAENSQLLAKS